MSVSKQKNTQSREYQITINNPLDKEMSHQNIKEILSDIPTIIYWCLCDEIGAEQTPHTHIYFKTKNPIRFSTLKKRFPSAHIEKAMGSATENRDYIRKEGAYQDSEKKETNLIETFEEWGTLPVSKQGKRTDLEILYDYIAEGLSTAEILTLNPNYMMYLSHIERTRQTIREEKYRNVWRDISCIYVFGETNTNKTRTYMEKYGYENVYRITNYNPAAVWDGYRGQDTVIFEEYRSQILISELLVWLEGYPNASLRARYSDKVASYTNVIIISNIPLEAQYPNVQTDSPPTWRAFLRRIQKVIHHRNKTEIITYDSVDAYFRKDETFRKLADNETTPFDNDTDTMPFDD